MQTNRNMDFLRLGFVVLCYLLAQGERLCAIVGIVIDPTRSAAGRRWLPPGIIGLKRGWNSK
jgi:hypothetical protein